MHRQVWFALAALTLAGSFALPASAGVVNPDISVIGQPFMRWTDDFADPSRRRVTLDVGEIETVFDADLNPYARGSVTLAIGAEGLELEEGFLVISRGLPANLALKGGKYRAGFGRVNPAHPHTYAFGERFRVLAAYLPGEESLNETGVQLSTLVPLAGDGALTASADWLSGTTYRVARESGGAANDPLATDPDNGDLQEEPRPAGLGRVSAFLPIGAQSGLDLGVSGTEGTNNAAAGTRTRVLGGDAKAKLWTGPRAYLVLQGEWLALRREDAAWDETAAAYAGTTVESTGGYVFADYNFDTRYNLGASYERYQQAVADGPTDQAFRMFAGLALLEETTAFRFDWEHLRRGREAGAPSDPEAVNTLTLRVIWSMGPHKAHQF